MTRDRLLQLIMVFYGVAVIVAIASLIPHAKDKKPGRFSGTLAIVRIYGPIQISSNPSPWGTPDADAIAKRLHEISEDDEVKAILLRINSPGGTVAAVQEINREIQRCKQKGKKVVASLGDVAASGGYYLAAAADSIVADPGTITGSIGVILQFGNLEGLFQKLGVRLQVIKSGAHKDIGSPARPLTAEEKALLQASINDAYEQFVEAVSMGRHQTADKVRPLADGRIFTGRQALAAGLVDALGNREDAIQKAIELGHLPAHPTIRSEPSKSLSSFLKHLSSELANHPLEALSERWAGPSIEYRWR